MHGLRVDGSAGSAGGELAGVAASADNAVRGIASRKTAGFI